MDSCNIDRAFGMCQGREAQMIYRDLVGAGYKYLLLVGSGEVVVTTGES
jgi:hypothetical protein